MVAEKRFVGLFDILGFKSIRAKLGTDELFRRMQERVLPSVRNAVHHERLNIELAGIHYFHSSKCLYPHESC